MNIRIQEKLLALILFLLPTNLFLKYVSEDSYVHGILVDYFIPKLYIVDIALILLLLPWIVQHIRNLTQQKIQSYLLPIGVGTFFFLRSLLSQHPLSSLWFFLSLALTILFFFWAIHYKDLFKTPIIRFSLALTILFQSLMGIYQFATQHAVGGYLFFGEPSFEIISLAKTEFLGVIRVLPYGTLPHPNVLAGILVFYILLLIRLRKKTVGTHTAFFFISILLGCITLILTQSITAIFTLSASVIFFCLQKTKKIHFNAPHILFLTIVTYTIITIAIQSIPTNAQYHPSLYRREQLQSIAVSVFTHNPFFGIGINQFPAYVQQFGGVIAPIQFLQPVHNIPLLILAEIGIVGTLFIFLFVYSEHKKYFINLKIFVLFIFPFIFIISLDHYLYTLHQGQLLTAIIFAFVISKKEN